MAANRCPYSTVCFVAIYTIKTRKIRVVSSCDAVLISYIAVTDLAIKAKIVPMNLMLGSKGFVLDAINQYGEDIALFEKIKRIA